MTTYILLGNHTEQGSRRIRESPTRLDKARAILRCQRHSACLRVVRVVFIAISCSHTLPALACE